MIPTKRVYELEVGDCFRYYNVEFKVSAIEKGRIYYKPLWFGQSYNKDSFGEKNKMRVEIIPVSNGGNQKTDIANQPELEHDF